MPLCVLVDGMNSVLASIDTLIPNRNNIDDVDRDSIERLLCATLGWASRDYMSHSSFNISLTETVHMVTSQLYADDVWL